MVECNSTVIIVDDDVSVREAVAGLVRASGWQAQTFATAEAFLTTSALSAPSCLVLDLGLPDLSGLDVQTLVARERAEMPIIFITGCGDIPTSVQAMKAGAVEFLTKPFDKTTLLNAIRCALDRSAAALGLSAERRRIQDRYNSLSRREKDVMAGVVRGLLNKQVAWELGISEITVKVHRGRVMEKMQVRSLAELVRRSQHIALDHAS